MNFHSDLRNDESGKRHALTFSTGRLCPPADSGLSLWDNPEVVAGYTRFAQASWYQTVLDTMIDMLPRVSSSSLIDVGSGTGEGTLRLAKHAGPGSHVLGIDPSAVQTEFASTRSASGAQVEFLPCSVAEAVERFAGTFDGLVAFNSIHLLGSAERSLVQLASLVRPGGFLAFCTGYTTEALEFPERRASVQMLEVMIALAARYRVANSAPSREGAGQEIRSIHVRLLREQLDAAGLVPEKIVTRPFEIPAESLADFLALPGMTSAILPAGLSSEIVREIASEALAKCGISSLSRTWHFVVAKRR
jgi:SAM-dependent methyltransferase